MKVALCVPETDLPLNVSCPPLNLGYLASYLRVNVPDVEVQIFDGAIGQPVRRLIEEFNPEIVGVSATTPQAPYAYDLADYLRHSIPYVQTVLGGVHASVLPNEALEHFDVVVVGEGETALRNIIEHGVTWNKRIIHGNYIENLDEIPSPAFDLMDIESYLRTQDNPGYAFPFGLDHVRTATILTSRGCPFECIFCWNSFRTSPPRWNSAERVVEEIQYFVDNHRVNSVFFVDDEFVVNKKRLRRLETLFREHGLDESLVFGCQARSTTLDVESMRRLVRMGFKFASVGFESGNPRVLGLLKNHKVTVEDNERLLRVARRVGLGVGGSFIFGTPTETREEMLDTLRFMERHKDLLFMGVNVLIPYPHTRAWEICVEKGLLPEKLDYRRLIPTSKATDTYIVCDTMSPTEFKSLVTDIQRIAIVTEKMRMVRKIGDLTRLFRHKLYYWFVLRHPFRFFRLVYNIVK